MFTHLFVYSFFLINQFLIILFCLLVCKSCLVKYLNDSNKCPTCDTIIHPSYPLERILHDGLLEDIINKILPNLYFSKFFLSFEYFLTSKYFR